MFLLQKNTYFILFVIILIFGLCSCIPKNLSYQDTSVQMGKVAIQYATLKYIGNDKEKAEKIQEIITWAYSEVDDKKFVSLSILDQEIRARIQWKNLLPSEKFATEEFLTFIKTYLENLYVDLGLDADHVGVYVKEVLIWIDQAANYV